MAADVAPRFGFAEIGGIDVDGKNHIARLVNEDRIMLGGNVVKKLPDFEHIFFVWDGLVLRQGRRGGQALCC